ncbi:carbon storage regulator CsrA [Legionella pneumophila serogroup 1]|uniref:carbon storage regulator CsrA n=1 Tax=Legionella pneumophila TaxID=446 RepID=UPI0039C08ACC|nr:carbon storage regulator CsrA [Legionella pneumophila subsp. pneumophila]
MLILTRRISETVLINDDIYITVLGVKGNQVRLGFDAPNDVIIHRQEIHQKIKKEQQALFLNKPGKWKESWDIRTH